MSDVTLFERQDAELEHIASFWSDVSAEKWRNVVMAVIAPHDGGGTDKCVSNSAACRIPVAKGKFNHVLDKVTEFCEPRGIKIVSHNVSGAHLDVVISPKERAVDVATFLEMVNLSYAVNKDFMLRRRSDAWVPGDSGSDISVIPAGVSCYDIKCHTADYIIEYMAQVTGDEWHGGRADIHGFAEFMNRRMLYVSMGKDRVIADAIINNIYENEETFKEEATNRYLKRVEMYLQNPDSVSVSPAAYKWATKQLLNAQCRFDGQELNIKVQLKGGKDEIEIVPYDLGENTERVKTHLGLHKESGYVDIDALRNVLVQIREVVMKTS